MFAEHYIDDRLPDDDEVYAFDELLNEHDLSEILNSYRIEGGKLYSPRDVTGVLLYAYSKGITSCQSSEPTRRPCGLTVGVPSANFVAAILRA